MLPVPLLFLDGSSEYGNQYGMSLNWLFFNISSDFIIVWSSDYEFEDKTYKWDILSLGLTTVLSFIPRLVITYPNG